MRVHRDPGVPLRLLVYRGHPNLTGELLGDGRWLLLLCLPEGEWTLEVEARDGWSASETIELVPNTLVNDVELVLQRG